MGRGLVLLAVASLLPSCTAAHDSDGERGGPLQAPGYGGRVSVFAPTGRDEWSATFGEKLLCVDGSEEVVLTGISYDVATEPVAVDTWLRRVPAKSEQVGGGTWDPIISRVGGRAGVLGTSSRVRGAIETDVEGQVVDVRCDDDTGAFVEPFTVMQVDSRGGQTDEMRVDYTADGRPYSLVVNWTYVACGTDVAAQDACRKAPPSR